jgi:hypothetical protein
MRGFGIAHVLSPLTPSLSSVVDVVKRGKDLSMAFQNNFWKAMDKGPTLDDKASIICYARVQERQCDATPRKVSYR